MGQHKYCQECVEMNVKNKKPWDTSTCMFLVRTIRTYVSFVIGGDKKAFRRYIITTTNNFSHHHYYNSKQFYPATTTTQQYPNEVSDGHRVSSIIGDSFPRFRGEKINLCRNSNDSVFENGCGRRCGEIESSLSRCHSGKIKIRLVSLFLRIGPI